MTTQTLCSHPPPACAMGGGQGMSLLVRTEVKDMTEEDGTGRDGTERDGKEHIREEQDWT